MLVVHEGDLFPFTGSEHMISLITVYIQSLTTHFRLANSNASHDEQQGYGYDSPLQTHTKSLS